MTDHELRVALVLNGGVSLAVWMAGVVHDGQGRTVLIALLQRMLAVSGGVSPRFGAVVKAVGATDQQPRERYLRSLRWVTEPARGVVWRGVVSGVPQQSSPAPVWVTLWPAIAALACAVALAVTATVVDVRPAAVVLALAAGVSLAVAAALLAARWLLRRVRASIHTRADRVITPARTSSV
jgi:hypothetical protein